MEDLLIVDTDILIDAARAMEDAVGCLERWERESSLAISVVTEMELLVGCENKGELKDLKHFLRRYRILHTSEAISRRTLQLLEEYNLSHGLLVADALIAATAITWDCAFVSKNQRDYRYIADLELLSYP
jgi:hypothetical protein